jgi:hypothetical protein
MINVKELFEAYCKLQNGVPVINENEFYLAINDLFDYIKYEFYEQCFEKKESYDEIK